MLGKKNRKTRIRILALLMMFCLIICGNNTNVTAKSRKLKNITNISLKIGNKKVTKKVYNIHKGNKKKLVLHVSPGKAKKTVKYDSSNKKVATVNHKGVITAKKKGTSKIKVSVSAKNYRKKIVWVKIKVIDADTRQKENPVPSNEPVVTARPTATPQNTEVPNAPAATATPSPDNPSDTKNIVVYFSCTDNTKRIAEYVAEGISAHIYRIEAAIPYTAADLNYNDANSRTSVENKDSAARPEIAGVLPSLDEYTNIYIGYPIWHGQAPKILYTFVEHYSLSGKTVIPFCTSASSGIGTSASNLQTAAKWQSDWLVGKRFSGSASESEVINWALESIR